MSDFSRANKRSCLAGDKPTLLYRSLASTLSITCLLFSALLIGESCQFFRHYTERVRNKMDRLFQAIDARALCIAAALLKKKKTTLCSYPGFYLGSKYTIIKHVDIQRCSQVLMLPGADRPGDLATLVGFRAKGISTSVVAIALSNVSVIFKKYINLLKINKALAWRQKVFLRRKITELKFHDFQLKILNLSQFTKDNNHSKRMARVNKTRS